MNLSIPDSVLVALEQLDLTVSVPVIPEIEDLLAKTVLFQGKKLRPLLCFLVGQGLNLPLKLLDPYARAAEFVHAATLAHDDVIDESPLRRNQWTLNRRASNVKAVLAGDLLLARVMEELSSLGQLGAIQHLAQTVEALVSGEWLQLKAKGVRVSRPELEQIALCKTGSLMGWSCAAPFYLLGSDAWAGVALKLAQQLGETLGLAFQMIDDVLDYQSSTGKPLGQDLRQGLINFVSLELLELEPGLVEELKNLLAGWEPQVGAPAPQPMTSVVLGAAAERMDPGSSHLISRDLEAFFLHSSGVQQACARVRAQARLKLIQAQEHLNHLADLLSQQGRPLEALAQQALRSLLSDLQDRVV